MYALPRNQRIAIRSKDDPSLERMIDGVATFARLTGSWDRGNIGVIFANQVGVERASERWWKANLFTGVTKPLRLFPPSPLGDVQPVQATLALQCASRPVQPHVIDPGQAFITRRRSSAFVQRPGNLKSLIGVAEDMTIYVDRWLALDDPMNEDLDVARDAWFERDFIRARKLVGSLMPHSAELFLACIDREFRMLQERTA